MQVQRQPKKADQSNALGLSPAAFETAMIGVGYAVSSSCLVVVNKWALMAWPYSSSLTFLQFTVSWMVALVAGKIGLVEVDALDVKKMLSFAPACLIFFVAIACNMRLLQHANVDTFIVLRSLVPLLTNLTESLFLGTPLPSRQVLSTLVLIIIGAVGYVVVDDDFSLTAYGWGAAYVGAMVTDTVLVKKVVTDVELKPWGLVLYNNLIASMIYPFFILASGEYAELGNAYDSLINSDAYDVLSPVLISCVFGVAISYFGMNARKKLNATSFSVLGVVCKFATVVVNSLAWDYHSSAIGTLWMCVSIAGGILYQQVLRGKVKCCF